MASVTTVSSDFTIHCVMDAAAAHVVTGPDRGYKVIGISAFNAGGTPNITVAGSGDIAATQAVTANSWLSLVLTPANTEVAAGQALTITNANATTTEVVIHCVAPGGGSSLVST
jgi:hypothetical protein